MDNIAKEFAPYFVTDEKVASFFEEVPASPEIKEAGRELAKAILDHSEISPNQFIALKYLERCIQLTVPGFTTPPFDFDKKAQQAFEAYQIQANGIAMVGWDGLTEAGQANWIAVVKAVA